MYTGKRSEVTCSTSRDHLGNRQGRHNHHETNDAANGESNGVHRTQQIKGWVRRRHTPPKRTGKAGTESRSLPSSITFSEKYSSQTIIVPLSSFHSGGWRTKNGASFAPVPALLECCIDEATFLHFLDSLNQATKVSISPAIRLEPEASLSFKA